MSQVIPIKSNTKHNNTCSMAFGRPSKHSDCPRCEELKAGSKPRNGWQKDYYAHKKRTEERYRKHTCNDSCSKPICTWGDW